LGFSIICSAPPRPRLTRTTQPTAPTRGQERAVRGRLRAVLAPGARPASVRSPGHHRGRGRGRAGRGLLSPTGRTEGPVLEPYRHVPQGAKTLEGMNYCTHFTLRGGQHFGQDDKGCICRMWDCATNYVKPRT